MIARTSCVAASLLPLHQYLQVYVPHSEFAYVHAGGAAAAPQAQVQPNHLAVGITA